MSRFTSSERRGTIALLFIMAIVVIFLAIDRNVGSRAPEATDSAVSVVPDVPESRTGTRDTLKRDRKTKQKKERRQKKSGPTTPSGKERSPLDETVN